MKTKIFKKSVVISAVLIIVVVVAAFFAYTVISMQQASQRVEQKLREEISQKGIMMEDYLQPEIALTKKLASSPTVIEFFKDPSDPVLTKFHLDCLDLAAVCAYITYSLHLGKPVFDTVFCNVAELAQIPVAPDCKTHNRH